MPTPRKRLHHYNALPGVIEADNAIDATKREFGRRLQRAMNRRGWDQPHCLDRAGVENRHAACEGDAG